MARMVQEKSFNEKGRTRKLTHSLFLVDQNGNSHLGLTYFVPVRVGEVRGRGAAGGLAPEVARHHLAQKILNQIKNIS